MLFVVIARCSRLQHGAHGRGTQCPQRAVSSASRGGRRSPCGEQHAGRVHLPPPPHPAGGSSRCPRAALRTSPRERRAGGGRTGARPARGARAARLGSERRWSGAERSGRWGKMEGASFGAGRAGGAVDPLDFLKQPQTILRATAWVRWGGQRAVAGHRAVPVAVCGAHCSVRCPCSLQCPGIVHAHAVCGARAACSQQTPCNGQRFWRLAPVGSSVGTGTVQRVDDAVALRWFCPWCLSMREQGAAQKQRTFSSHPCSLCACVREMKSYSQPCPAPPIHPNGCHICCSAAQGGTRGGICAAATQ